MLAAEAGMCRVGVEREGEVERLGVRRQETGEQGSPSECKRDKKERRKTLHKQRREGSERIRLGESSWVRGLCLGVTQSRAQILWGSATAR